MKEIIEDFLLDEFPQPFDQVEIGGIRGQEEQLNVKLLSSLQHEAAPLVAGIIQNDNNLAVIVANCRLLEQSTNGRGVHIGCLSDHDQFFAHSVDCPQHTETLASTPAFDIPHSKGVKVTEERKHDEMSGIHEQQFYFAFLRFFHQRLQRLCTELLLCRYVCFFRNLLDFPAQNPVFFRNALTCGKDRLMPVSSSILLLASLRVPGGCVSK